MGYGKIDFELYRYTPNIPAAVIFVVLFAATTLYHIYQLTRTRTWYFTAFVIGGIFQIIGYAGRIAAHWNKENIPLYSIQTILILLAPPLYAASIYMILGRLISHLQAEHFSIVPIRWMTGIFVTGDVFAFVMQGAVLDTEHPLPPEGGGIMATGTISAMDIGEKITIAGLSVQLVFFSFFVATSITFHRRIRREKTPMLSELEAQGGMTRYRSWESVLWGLYISSVLILIRSIFRLIEYAQGNDGYLISHEVFMYVFDSVLMFMTMVAMNVFHPSVILAGIRKQRSMESIQSDSATQLQSLH
ncbi:hypothetical protein FQN53_009092 [Emmonsiellopsis sp. PD_33]|nr:hypothetical protein FQN53_009092 [Emmonsiellopsis sp. PD_33]